MHMRTPPAGRARRERIRKCTTHVFVRMRIATIIGFVHLRVKRARRERIWFNMAKKCWRLSAIDNVLVLPF